MNGDLSMVKNAFITRERLTKKFFLGLQEDVYIVSNCYKMVTSNKHIPVFEEKVVPLDLREAQWKRIKSSRANHRLCYVYAKIEDYERLKADVL